jgi:alkylresorcinol/alkylpyrone synthase
MDWACGRAALGRVAFRPRWGTWMIPQAVRVMSVGTAVPPYRVDQEHAKAFAREMFSDGGKRNVERLLRVFDHTGIDSRHLCVPFEWAKAEHTFAQKNDLYVEHAVDLSAKAARRALDKVGADPEDVGALIFASNTGTSSPTVPHKLISLLGLSPHMRIVPIYGRGCAGGAVALPLAADQVRLRPDRLALVVAVELASFTYQRTDLSKANLISSAIFADGAASVLLGATGGGGPRIVGGHSTTWPETEDIMGWEYIETGMKVQLSRDLTAFLRERLPETLDAACASLGVEPAQIDHFLAHPGGPKVLDALEEMFGIEPGGLKLSRSILRDYGNMSSAAVLFILERFLEQGNYETEDLALITALGPGFSCEHVFLRC